MNPKIREIAFICAINAFFLILIEIGFRFYAHTLHTMPADLKDKNITDASRILRPSVHPQAGFRFYSQLDINFLGKKFTTNSLGFRGREFSKEKKLDVLRIGIIGDSVSSGWGVSDEEVYSRVLEKSLIEKCKKAVEVYNMAIPGQSATQEFFVLREFINYSFDLVIINYVGNDWVDESVARPRDYIDTPSYALNFIIVNILSKLSGFRSRQSLEWRPTQGRTISEVDNLPRAYSEMASLLNRQGVKGMVLMDSRYESEFKSHKEIEKMFNNYGLPTINLLEKWHPIEKMSGDEAVRLDDEHNRKYLIPEDFHPNEIWHSDVALKLSSLIECR